MPSPSIWRALRAVFDITVLGLAATSAVAGLAAQGGRWNDRLDLLTHFAPVWLAGGLASLLFAGAIRRGRRRMAATGLALSAIAAAAVLILGGIPRQAHPSQVRPAARAWKVIEFNAWEGSGDAARVAHWLASEAPDIAIILEPPPALSDEIARTTDLHVFQSEGVLFATRNALLSTRVGWELHDLPGIYVQLIGVQLPGPDGKALNVFGAHFGRPIPARHARAQFERLIAVLRTQDHARVLLAGDFNSTPWSFRHRSVEASLAIDRRDRMALTWPTHLPAQGAGGFLVPFLAIDHVYAGTSWRTVSTSLGPRFDSDHLPLVVNLAWDPPR